MKSIDIHPRVVADRWVEWQARLYGTEGFARKLIELHEGIQLVLEVGALSHAFLKSIGESLSDKFNELPVVVSEYVDIDWKKMVEARKGTEKVVRALAAKLHEKRMERRDSGLFPFPTQIMSISSETLEESNIEPIELAHVLNIGFYKNNLMHGAVLPFFVIDSDVLEMAREPRNSTGLLWRADRMDVYTLSEKDLGKMRDSI